jgi:hypothetical protein
MRAGRRKKKPSPLTILRSIAPAFLALAFLLQNYVAERHFHTIGLVSSAPTTARTADFIAKPFVPASDQQDDDCPLCQVLGLGVSTDVPAGVVFFSPAAIENIRIAFALTEAKPQDILRSDHGPRGPPSFSLA